MRFWRNLLVIIISPISLLLASPDVPIFCLLCFCCPSFCSVRPMNNQTIRGYSCLPCRISDNQGDSSSYCRISDYQGVTPVRPAGYQTIRRYTSSFYGKSNYQGFLLILQDIRLSEFTPGRPARYLTFRGYTSSSYGKSDYQGLLLFVL
jgi:hypothetical protein